VQQAVLERLLDRVLSTARKPDAAYDATVLEYAQQAQWRAIWKRASPP